MSAGSRKRTLAIVIAVVAIIGLGALIVTFRSNNPSTHTRSISINVEDFSSLVDAQGRTSDVGGRITINNTSPVRMVAVSVYINDWQIGKCNVQIDPNQVMLLVSPCARGSIPCSSLQGGMPYTVKVVATFIDGGTATTSGSYSGMTAGSC
jgi:hypothetical protein